MKAPVRATMVHGISVLRSRAVVAAAIACTVAIVAPASAGQVAVAVNKTTQQMTVSVDGKPRWTWPVSTGVARFDTPSGSYTAFRMEAEHYSKEWDDAPMPHSIFFTRGGHAIHGTLHERNLGRRASHGCVRLSQRNAAMLFALVRANGLANTRVSVFSARPQTQPEPLAPPPFAPPPVFNPWAPMAQTQ